MPIEKEPEGKYISAKNLKLPLSRVRQRLPAHMYSRRWAWRLGWSNFKGNIDAFREAPSHDPL